MTARKCLMSLTAIIFVIFLQLASTVRTLADDGTPPEETPVIVPTDAPEETPLPPEVPTDAAPTEEPVDRKSVV
jgi:hypothetical protein